MSCDNNLTTSFGPSSTVNPKNLYLGPILAWGLNQNVLLRSTLDLFLFMILHWHIVGVPQKLSPLQSSKFNFNSSSSTTFGPKTLNSSGFKINPSVITNSTNNAGDNRVRNNFVNNAAKPSNTSKRKTDFDDSFSYGLNE